MVTIRRIVSIRIPKTHHISPRDTQTVAMAMGIPFVFTGDFPNDDDEENPWDVPTEACTSSHSGGDAGNGGIFARRWALRH